MTLKPKRNRINTNSITEPPIKIKKKIKKARQIGIHYWTVPKRRQVVGEKIRVGRSLRQGE